MTGGAYALLFFLAVVLGCMLLTVSSQPGCQPGTVKVSGYGYGSVCVTGYVP